MKPRVADLCCKAGGTSKGLADAGFEVVGFDIAPQPNYPFEFHQANALLVDLSGFDAAVVGCPCQAYSVTRTLHNVEYPRLIGTFRELLTEAGIPFVIESVRGARSAMRNPVQLCGSSFGLGVWRHRLFEFSFPVEMPPPCAHHLCPEPVDVTGTGARRLGARLDGKGGNSRKPYNLAHAREVMGIDWMTRRELSESIPPRVAHWVGSQLAAHLEGRVAA